MRINVRFTAELHKIKDVKYQDDNRREAHSYRLILDIDENTTVEIRCTEEVKNKVRKYRCYEFIASVETEASSSGVMRITDIANDLGYVFDDDDYDDDYKQAFAKNVVMPEQFSCDCGQPALHETSAGMGQSEQLHGTEVSQTSGQASAAPDAAKGSKSHK